MHAKKRLLLACAFGVALIPAVPVIAQAPPLAVLMVRPVADPAAGSPAVVALAVIEPSILRLTLLAPGGDPVLERKLAVARAYRFVWTGMDAWGNAVGPGTYRLVVDCSCGRALVSTSVELRVVGRGEPKGDGQTGPRPNPPTDLAVVAAQANTLSWTASPSKDVVAYRVYRSPIAGGPFQLLGQSAITTFDDVPGEQGIYWYRVSAVTSKNRESVPTGVVSSDNVHMAQIVGPDGGTIAPTTGTVRLEIPAGAVPTDTTFTIEQMSGPPSAAAQMVAVSRSFEIGPTGTTFVVPATLTLRLDPPVDEPLPRNYPADTTWVQYWNGSSWISLSGAAVDIAGSTVEVPVNHLSLFGANGVTVPHGGYTDQTSLCGYCHATHNAPGPTLQAYPTQRETCYQCHSSGQGSKVNEVQQIALAGTWVAGEVIALLLEGQTTAPITVDPASPSATATNISNALLDLSNVDGSSAPPNPELGVDGVSVTGTGPFTVTFQNGQGNRDVRQMVAYTTSAAGTVSVSTVTNGIGIYPGATNDILGAFGETWPVNNASTRTSYHPVPAARDGFQIKCSDCHTAHRDPATYTKLLRRPDGSGGYIYSPVAGPAIGNQFCTLGCHDSTSTYPAPFGDHTAFQGSAHDVANVPTANEVQRVAVDATGGTFKLIFAGDITAALAYNITAANLQTALVGLTSIGAGNVLVTGGPGGAGAVNPYVVTFQAAKAAKDVPAMVSDRTLLTGGASTAVVTTTINGRAAQPSGDVRCLSCHDPHASDNRRLTDASQETLCLSCHTASTPNTSGGTNPPWTRGPFPGSNIVTAFGTANDYSTTDGNGIRIYHHPISTTDQPGGNRSAECESCHNSHLVDRTDGATTSKASNPANVFQKWLFGWDFTSGYLSRGTNVTQYCTTCHVSPTTTSPLNAGTNVPYNVRMVNDTSNDADGNAHDKFAATQWSTARHGNPTLTPSSLSYKGCANRGLSGSACVVTCSNCHDFHGSSNAYMLRENVVAPDAVVYTVTNASWKSGVVTLTITPPNSIGLGVQIVVAGITPSGYNGTFTTTNSNTGNTITYALAANPGIYTSGGTVTPRTTNTITGFTALNTAADRLKLQTFCLTCHIERGTSHQSGNLCTECHYHGSNKL